METTLIHTPLVKDVSPATSEAFKTSSMMATAVQQVLQPLLSDKKAATSLQKSRLELEQELAIAREMIEVLRAENADMRQQLALAVQREAETSVYAYRDELTGLFNRRLLKDRMQQAILYAARHQKQVALLLIDMDGFKEINDTLGHAAGDELLCAVAERLTVSIRATDTACRYGGDEFIVVLPELDGPDAVEAVTQKIYACLDTPYLLGGQERVVKASIGRAVYPNCGQSYHDLIAQADAEMYRVKAGRR